MKTLLPCLLAVAAAVPIVLNETGLRPFRQPPPQVVPMIPPAAEHFPTLPGPSPADIYRTTVPSVVSIGSNEVKHQFGAGTFVADGLVVTAWHCVSDEAEYHVVMHDGRRLPVTVAGVDEANDIALLRVDVAVRAVALGDGPAVGDRVFAIGTPYGIRESFSTGLVSGLGRTIKTSESQSAEVIQVSVGLNPGNSGGPLLNSSGEVVGVCVAIRTGSQGIGYAVPASRVRDLLARLPE